MNHFITLFARLQLTLLLFLLVSTARAATYYFSTSQGDDNRTAAQAQNQATPWKTIAKLNAIFSTLAPGDVILFNRGEVFEGAITATKSGVAGNPIVFSAYGTGVRPVISAFATLSGWVNLGNGVWEAPLVTEVATLNLVTINDVPRAMGRYPNADAPNKGYLTIDGYVGNTQITDNQLPASPSWNGAEVVIRKNRWIIDRNKVTGHSGTVLNYTSASFYHAGTGYGYFIQNHAATLDAFGEWFHDKANGKLRVYFGANSPGSYAVKASRKESAAAVQTYQHLSFNNLSFQGANLRTFDVNNTNGISIVNCDILFSGGDAISGTNAQNVKLENSTVTDTYSTAFSLVWQCPGATVKNNVIKNTGFLAGMGQSGDFTYQAILAIGDNALIEGNRVEATGGAPLSFRGNNAVCKFNVVDGFAFVKDDAGAVHIWNNMDNFVPFTGQKILDNLFLNGTGAPEGTPNPDLYLSEGIYLDDNSANVEVARNTVSRCGKGLYVHNAHELDIHDNTFFDNRDYQVFMEHDNVAADKPIRNVLFNNNVLASKDPRQGLMSLRTKDNDIAQFGTFNYNYYTRTIGGNAIAVNVITGKGTASQASADYNLDRWKTVYSFEANATELPPAPHYKINGLVGANKFPNQTFSTGGYYPVWRYAPAGNLELAVDNTNKLDGNSLKAYFTAPSTTTGRCVVYAEAGAVDAAKKYIVRFSVVGANVNRTLHVALESAGNQTVARKSFKSTTTRKDYEFLLEPSAGLTAARLLFEFAEPDGGLWFDNIELYEADVTIDPGHVRFEYNGTNAATTVSLGGFTYRNAKGATRSGSLSLAAFASEVLTKQGGEPCTASGTILREYWANVAGEHISLLPLNTAPTSTSQITSLETAVNAADNYGQRIRGYICAPATGNYTFYVASDNTSALYLGTDNNPATKTKIAFIDGWTNSREWTKYPSQQSVVVALEAGKSYYVEVLHKEGAGGDNLAVGWTIPGSTTINVIPGSVLSPFVPAARIATADAAGHESLAVHPNPFSDRITLRLGKKPDGPVAVTVTDVLGKVYHRSLMAAGGPAEATIHLAGKGMRPGLYFLTARTAAGVEVIKIIRQ
jgi:parallel beta-helix repeat protein